MCSCPNCGADQPTQARGRPRTRCVVCRSLLAGGGGPLLGLATCEYPLCDGRAMVGALCAFHAAVEQASTRCRCIASSCERPEFSAGACHVHARKLYRRYLPLPSRRQIEEQVVGSGWLRAWRVWREGRWSYGRRGQLLCPLYRAGHPNRLLAVLLALLWEGQCHLCGGPLDALTTPGHLLSLTVDHVKPQSYRGSHLVSNLAPAHWVCNIAKGNRMSVRHERVRLPEGRLRGARKAAVVGRGVRGRRVVYRRRWYV